MTCVNGTLAWDAKGRCRLSWTSLRGKSVEPQAVPLGVLDRRLRPRVGSSVAVTVELGRDGRPLRAWPADADSWEAPGATVAAPAPVSPSRSRPARATGGGGRPSTKRVEVPRRSEFLNPYGFVPTPPRPAGDPDLGDHDPRLHASHDRLHPGRWSGCVTLRLRCETPLLVLDASRSEDRRPGVHGDQHLWYPVRVDPDGRPLLATTAVKGMVRSAYEAVTNSRFGVFAGHDRRLGYRQDSTRAVHLVPARIDENGRVRLLPGTRPLGAGNDQPLHAAWIARYGRRPLTLVDGTEPEHGMRAAAWLVLVERTMRNRRRQRLWRVLQLAPDSEKLTQRAPSAAPDDREQVVGKPRIETGWVCLTGANIEGKHDERFFFDASPTIPQDHVRDLDVRVRSEWEMLIDDYVQTNRRRKERRERHRPPIRLEEPYGDDPAFSWHLIESDLAKALAPGTLVYAQLDSSNQVSALFPVSISRVLHDASPEDLVPVDDHLRPATTIELSPADRVFGWVNGKGSGAWAGQVRLGRVRCLDEDAVVWFRETCHPDAAPGLPLAILGEPKEQQSRFYVAGADGQALADHVDRAEVAYRHGRRLRGRKVYPHHAALHPDHWDDPMRWRSSQEYRRPPVGGRTSGPEQQDSQNRTIEGWVRQGTRFEVDLHVENLSDVEMGALLWLAALPDGHYLRLGLGKPLGFGSVRVTIGRSHLRYGRRLEGRADGEAEDWASWYLDLDAGAPASTEGDPPQAPRLLRAFQEAVERAYRVRFADAPFIRAFGVAARGVPGLPVHYPRSTREPDPKGENFKWFVSNERGSRYEHEVYGYALPDMVDRRPGLPYLGGSPPARRPRRT